MSLATKYRPQTFEDFVGQKTNVVVLSKMVDEGAVPSALIFEGPKGTGKTSMARVLASAIAGEDLVLSVIEIDGASNGLVDDIRRLQDTLMFSWASARIIIIDEAQSMSRAAFNAMLKILEEPPPGIYFIFVTTEPHKIPETIRSRCITFQFGKLSDVAVKEKLIRIVSEQGIKVSAALLDYIVQSADGSMRTAEMSLEQAHKAGISELAEYEALNWIDDFSPLLLAKLVEGDIAASYTLTRNALAKNSDPHHVQDELVKSLRDVLTLHAGGTVKLEGKRLADRKALTSRISSLKAVAALKVLWDAKTKIKSTEDPKLVLDMVIALLADTLTEGGLK